MPNKGIRTVYFLIVLCPKKLYLKLRAQWSLLYLLQAIKDTVQLEPEDMTQ